MTWEVAAALLLLFWVVGGIVAWAIWGNHGSRQPPYPHD